MYYHYHIIIIVPIQIFMTEFNYINNVQIRICRLTLRYLQFLRKNIAIVDALSTRLDRDFSTCLVAKEYSYYRSLDKYSASVERTSNLWNKITWNLHYYLIKCIPSFSYSYGIKTQIKFEGSFYEICKRNYSSAYSHLISVIIPIVLILFFFRKMFTIPKRIPLVLWSWLI